MKRVISVLLAAVLLLSLCACTQTADPEQTQQTDPVDHTATQSDSAKLEALYAGMQAYQGEFHDHADTGGTSDGKSSLREWKDMMRYMKNMDFAAIVDHRQVLHMRLEDWDNAIFIGGTEAATTVKDSKATQKRIHYNMIFATPEPLELVLNAFPTKYQYTADHFQYPSFTTEEFTQVAQMVLDNGGFLTHVHPKGDEYMVSDDPLDYWFVDGMGIEVLCGYYGNMSAMNNQEAYQMWTQLLDLGKRVYATAGSDSHRLSKTVSLSTVYAPQQNAQAYLAQFRAGNFTAGPVGIRMCVGDTATGGTGSFAQSRVVISVGDFHSLEYDPTHTYRVELYNDTGVVFSQDLTGEQTQYFAIDADPDARYYRANVYDVTGEYIFAVGNPIWNG